MEKKKLKTVEIVSSNEELDEEYESIPCPKCGELKVIGWSQQTRSSDEPPTRFYKCMKCGYTWREYT
ncbi:hypothetical protein IHI26_01255 [Candidatus Parvarchaeota archaeon]|jgi:DNA-directed RNA polymerase subunit M|nr:hypothetical protein [Candidatus Acidifodinimicrobium mancum]MBE5729251.1 hypothetical protein [Candidatus Acidifodinimicrobium mancum]MBE5729947.1 hypothetical protein [Candidatus Acidifodinimicrobium mancum]